MKNIILIFFLSVVSIANSQSFEIVKFDKVESVLNSKNDTLYVLNFWATWCQPCVKELPYFDEMNAKYKNEKVKIILISMDFKSDVEARLIPFLEKRKMNSTVWFLDETNQNEFIPKVEDGWSGAIPFTIMVRGADMYRYWKEGKLSLKDLDKLIGENL